MSELFALEQGAEGVAVRDAVAWASGLLASKQCDTPRLDAEVLLGFVLGMNRARLHARWRDAIGAASAARYADLVQRRARHEPVAYLVGERAFYDVDLFVTSDVLIPRPETEHLLEEALAWTRGRARPQIRALDVGTGSGALALSLARHLPQVEVWAVDRSLAALDVARRNLARYGLERRVALVCGDLLAGLAGPFDLIVANLPYIPRADLAQLAPDVADYEPHLALDGGEDGLDLIRRLLSEAPTRLAPDSLLLLEIDSRQGQAVARLASKLFPGAEIVVLQDYAGLDRVVRIERRTKYRKG